MLLTPAAQGVFPIAPTAFHPDGRIDTASMDRLTDFYVACGATGVTVLGQMGEAPKLSHSESVAITTQMIRRAPSLPVIVGVSSPGFASMDALTQEVMAAGAAAVMIGPPNTLRTDDQVINYYRQAADALGPNVPIVVQDYPLSFAVQMSPSVIRTMVQEIPSIVMLRHETGRGWKKSARCANLKPTTACATSPSCAAMAACFWTLKCRAVPMAPTPAIASPICCVTWCACLKQDSAIKPMTCLTPTCPCCVMSSNRALAWRCANT